MLVYDGECPVCTNYSRVVRIRDSLGKFTIVNARDEHPVMNEITAAGLDIDEGMVLKLGDQLYYGADAVNTLALISSRSGLFNRFNYIVFRSERVANYLYPILRGMRNLLLKLLRKSKINNLGDSQ